MAVGALSSRGLNPEAREYIPISREATVFTYIPSRSLSAPSVTPYSYYHSTQPQPPPPLFSAQPWFGVNREWRGTGGDGNREGFGVGVYERREGRAMREKATHKHKVMPLRSDEPKTTVMIKNVPNKYTRKLLMKFLDMHCTSENNKRNKANTVEEADDDEQSPTPSSAYDFLYLPVDFNTGCNKGYAFVNFTNPDAVWKFYHAFNNKTWDFLQSPKTLEIVCAKIQGKEALVKHFEESTFICRSDEYLPVCFDPPRDGCRECVRQHTVVGRRIPRRQ